MKRNKIFLSIYPLPALLTSLSLIPFTPEEFTDCTYEAAEGANKAGRNLLSFFCFRLYCFCFAIN